jgi:antitoxin component YwqK of YwqJK toxin-antitoxin module
MAENRIIIETGINQIYHNNGILYKEYFKINNKREGQLKKFDKKGNLIYICNYVNNRKNGDEFCYYLHNNNIIESKTQYCNGKKNGEVKYYYENGNIKFITNFINDIKNGEHIEYYLNGDIKEKSIYNKGYILDKT